MSLASSLAWKTFSEKSGRCGIAADYERALPMIDWVISVRQSTVAAISGLHRRALLWLFEHKADSLIAKFKEAGGTWSGEIDVWAESLRLSPLWLSASSSACRAVNHYRDNAITYKAQCDKMPENWSWRTRQLLTCRCVSVMLLRSM